MLLIEGAGGLLAPLGESYTALDLIVKLRCEAIVVAPNRLGTINHTLLTVRALEAAGAEVKVALVGARNPDPSALSNASVLGQLLARTPVLNVPYLGELR